MDVRIIGVMKTTFNLGETGRLSPADSGILAGVAAELAKKKGHSVQFERANASSSELRYASLDQDATPGFLRPVFVLTGLDALAPRAASGGLSHLTDIREIELRIFDNRIAMIEFAATIVIEKVPEDWNAGQLEQSLTEAADRLASKAQKEVMNPLSETLRGVLAKAAKPNLLQAARDAFAVSTDLSPYAPWPDDRTSLLWAGRLYVQSDPDGMSSREKQLSRWDELSEGGATSLKFLRAHSGTSFLLDPNCMETFRTGHRCAQLIYALFDLVQDSQVELDDLISAERGATQLAGVARSLDKMTAFLARLRAERRNAEIKLQGGRLQVFRTMNTAFSLDDLVEAVQWRADVLEKRLSLLLQTKGVLQDAVIQFALYVIGAFQLVEVFSSLYEFSVTTAQANEDPVVGVSDVLSRISFNGAVNVLVLIAVISALAVFARRRRS